MLMSQIERENRLLKQLLVDADAVARMRGDEFGLCDALLKDGESYPSAALGFVLRACAAEGFSACITLQDSLQSERDPNSPWHESIQNES